MIKKILAGLILLLLGLLILLFFRPGIIINPVVMKWGLDFSGALKSFSWKEADFRHDYRSWNERGFAGHFTDFCLEVDRPGQKVKTCFESIKWDLLFTWSRAEGFHFESEKPVYVRSSFTDVALTKDETPSEGPPDIYGYWKLLWGSLVPDLDVKFDKITLSQGEKPLVFDLMALKSKTTLEVQTLGYRLTADPRSFDVSAPAKILLPVKDQTSLPLFARDMRLHGDVDASAIKLELSGLMEVAKLKINTIIDLPLKDEFTSVAFQKAALLKTTGSLVLNDVKANLKKYGPAPFTALPAPLNIMDGSITMKLSTKATKIEEVVDVLVATDIDLKHPPHFFQVDIGTILPVDLKKRDFASILLDLNFRKVSLPLPRLSKKSLPPQFVPDSRFKKYSKIEKTAEKKKEKDLELKLEALGDRAISIKTNLLDEVLRFNFDLLVTEGQVQSGFVQVLPLKTTVFKRPIKLAGLKIKFQHPVEANIEAQVLFDLPDYKVTLDLEGPLSKPRHHFSSVPPLPLDDIYSVLLFGRPMSDLDPDDKNSARKTNRMLSQGILNLSVLYFFAGSSLQSLDYDPENSALAARFRLSDKNTLSVGQENGRNKAGVRRSLGKGWYLESTTGQGGQTQDASYGVLLERIIAY